MPDLASALSALAEDNENNGDAEAAACLYREVLKLQPDHAAVSYRLGLLEVRLLGAVAALPRFELAIEKAPQHELHWVGYIDTLIQTGALETAVSALEAGQQFGLSAATADAIAAECVAQLERRLNPEPVEPASIYSEEELAWPAAPVWPEVPSSQSANLDYIRLPAHTTARRYVIYAPFYRHNSAGIRVLYDLQKWLLLAGFDAIVIAAIHGYAPDQFADDIVIYPEVVFGNPLQARRVVRYILNVPGKLGGSKDYAPHELKVAYNELLAEHADGHVLNVPTIEPFFCPAPEPKTKLAVYVGKGQDLKLHPEECIYITRAFPSSRREVAKLLQQVKTFYLYDNFTAIGAEALLCGCEVLVIQADGSFTKLPRSILETVTSSRNSFRAELHDLIEMSQRLG